MMDLSSIGTFETLEAMLADGEIDVVDVCLPPAAHRGAVVSALEAGKHVFCEKPIALTAEDAKAMVAKSEEVGKLLMIGHVLPFFPEYQFVMQMIESGEYGKVTGGHFKRIISDPTWLENFYDPNMVGGPMLDLHVHDAHFIRLLFGAPREIRSVGSMQGEVAKRFSSQFLFDDPALTVTAASGTIDQQGRPFTHGYEIYFEKATVLFEWGALPDGEQLSMPVTLLKEDGTATQPEIVGGPEEAFQAEIGEVTKSLLAGKTSPILDGVLARDALVICHNETEAVRTRKPVTL